MLETQNLGGKCADLNALFVGFARSVGLPARDVYGIRVADSADFKSLGKSGDQGTALPRRVLPRSTSLGTAGCWWTRPTCARSSSRSRRGGLPLDDPKVQTARAKLFGAWEMNWMAYKDAHDVTLPGSSGAPVAFLMYPQAEPAAPGRTAWTPTSFATRSSRARSRFSGFSSTVFGDVACPRRNRGSHGHRERPRLRSLGRPGAGRGARAAQLNATRGIRSCLLEPSDVSRNGALEAAGLRICRVGPVPLGVSGQASPDPVRACVRSLGWMAESCVSRFAQARHQRPEQSPRVAQGLPTTGRSRTLRAQAPARGGRPLGDSSGWLAPSRVRA